ncbi:50S ribosomal protein L4 [Natranaerofaba carboxydovora]|uniref:50S ribosomal protein L4 n=1 Tax=Natranaerofaba carboxydovora TaxID=2742683 RepID=UPI001F13C2F2|nr:50S ribosomal protein L4 [Natranaerofaba carboxydovora]UMZ75394.1 50S ribosomal protein L4 [Natranaerofaba carboxydovora]
MPKVALYNKEGEEVGDINLVDEIFAAEIKEDVMHDVVNMQLASKRRGTASAKKRGEVRGGGRKPYRQKGTGRARAGTTRSPLWVGGSVIFGPKPRDYSYKLPKKVKRKALKSALSAKLRDGELVVVDSFELDQPKTKEVVGLLENLKVNKKAMLVTKGSDKNVYKSSRNIPGVRSIEADNINVYDILKYDHLILTKDAVNRIEEVFC